MFQYLWNILLGVSVVVFCCSSADEVYATELETATDFCYPVGSSCVSPEGYYNAQKFGNLNYTNGGQHLGEDWNGLNGGSTDYGDSVYAIANGVVVYRADLKGNWGQVLIIRHVLPSGKSVNSLYAHLSKIVANIGDLVKKRTKIGEVGDANGVYNGTAHLHFEIRVSSAMEQKAGYGYTYDKNVFALYVDPTDFIANHATKQFVFAENKMCSGITGGESTGWNYSCEEHKPTFSIGENVYVLTTIKNVWMDHRFKVWAYKNGNMEWNYFTDWNHVDPQWGWNQAQFWPALYNATVGNWSFYIYVEFSDKKTYYLGEVSFSVEADSTSKPPYQFVSAQACTNIIGPDSFWNFWCKGESNVFVAGKHVFTLMKLKNIWVDHRFRVQAYKGGMSQWVYTTDWNNVDGETGWNHSYFWPALWNAEPGFWQMDLYVGTKDNLFSYVGKVNFAVR